MPRPSSAKRPGFALGQRISTAEFLGIAALVFVVVGVSWYAVTATGLVGKLFLPSPAQVSPALAQMRAALATKLGADPATALQAVDVPGMTPNTEAGAQHLVGTKGQARVAVFSRGLRVYQAVMLGPKPLDEAAWRNFLGSLKCVEAARP